MIKEIKEIIIPPQPKPYEKITYKCDAVEGCEYSSIKHSNIISHIYNSHTFDDRKVIAFGEGDYSFDFEFYFFSSEKKYNLWLEVEKSVYVIRSFPQWTKPEWFVSFRNDDCYLTIKSTEKFLEEKQKELESLINLLKNSPK